MVNPVVGEMEKMAGHGLDREVQRWARRVGKRAEKNWANDLKSAHANENDSTAANDDHGMPVMATFEQLFTEAWQNADKPISAEHADFYHLAEIEARRELHRTLDANATVTLAPDDYMRLYTEMQNVAHAMVRETRDLTAGACKTQLGSNVLREKVKKTVQKFIGEKHGVSHAHCDHTSDGQQKTTTSVPTLTHLCGIELRAPTLFQHQHT